MYSYYTLFYRDHILLYIFVIIYNYIFVSLFITLYKTIVAQIMSFSSVKFLRIHKCKYTISRIDNAVELQDLSLGSDEVGDIPEAPIPLETLQDSSFSQQSDVVVHNLSRHKRSSVRQIFLNRFLFFSNI